jgi:ABC-2 type transport system permease protein
MADVTRLPGLVEQIRLVAGLRWRVLRNNLKNRNRRLDVIGLVISSFVGILFTVGLSIAFFLGTVAFLKNGRTGWIGLLFWAIFLWWQVMPIFVAGFSPSFSFRSLLRFPLKFTAFFVISIAYGLADSAAVAALCWLLAMAAGTAAAAPELLPAMLVASALFAALNVALERLVAAWMEKILAKRRSRELFFGLFLLLIVGVQFLGPAVEKYGRTAKPVLERALPYLAIFPGSLAGQAVSASAAQNWSAVLASLAGLAAYAVIFGGLLWRRLAVQYRGEELSETLAPQRALKKRAASESAATAGPETSLLPPAVAAVLGKEARYLLRNGFVLVSLIFPPILVLFFSIQFAGPHPGGNWRNRPEIFSRPDMFFPAMMAYVLLILMAPAYNCFAYEGRGMQTYFVLPLRFRDVLLGKNLMQTGLLATEMALCAAVLGWRIGLPSAPVLWATLAGVVFAVVGQLSLANWSSLTFPKKMEFGKMKGSRQSGMAVLVAFGAQLVFGAVCGPILFAGRLTGNVWLPAEIFAFLAAAAVAGYVASLDVMTRLAEKKKELLLEALGK